jgi:rare lipoprotein A
MKYLYFLKACRYKLQCGRLGIAVFIGLMSGCASDPHVVVPAVDTSAQTYRHKPAYNRPYTVRGKTYYPLSSAVGYREQGVASWYGSESGNRTAMGARFYPKGLSAAHKTLPLPTKVRVTNLRNGRYLDVLVNDRGPFKKGRLIDLSQGAAKRLGIHGLAEVEVEYLEDQSSAE